MRIHAAIPKAERPRDTLNRGAVDRSKNVRKESALTVIPKEERPRDTPSRNAVDRLKYVRKETA